jgi:hypothetical protein
MTRAKPLFSHIVTMTDTLGLFEHAFLRVPRPEHGYCVDDVARALIALCRNEWTAPADGPGGIDTLIRLRRGGPGLPVGLATWHEPRPATVDANAGGGTLAGPAVLAELARVYARFIGRAQTDDGRVVNRRDVRGVGHGAPSLEDCWGRAVWAWGTAAARSRDSELAVRASERFAVSAVRRSPWPRAMAFAGLGAAELMRIDPGRADARALLRDAAATVGAFDPGSGWSWPEPRLTYANAVLPDVLIAAGDYLHDDRLLDRGLAMLDWLVGVQLRDGHLSLTPATGWAAGEPLPGFDQQPIEAATLADACARAYDLTGDARWSDVVECAAGWFFGRNDTGVPLYDQATGGCCDGLEAAGRNENQGAESTLALITAVQHASRLAVSRA